MYRNEEENDDPASKGADAGADCGTPKGGDRGVEAGLSPSGRHSLEPIHKEYARWAYAVLALAVLPEHIWATWRLPPLSISFNW